MPNLQSAGTWFVFLLLCSMLHVVRSASVDAQVPDESASKSSIRIDHKGHSALMRHHHKHPAHRIREGGKDEKAADPLDDQKVAASLTKQHKVTHMRSEHGNHHRHHHHHSHGHHATHTETSSADIDLTEEKSNKQSQAVSKGRKHSKQHRHHTKAHQREVVEIGSVSGRMLLEKQHGKVHANQIHSVDGEHEIRHSNAAPSHVTVNGKKYQIANHRQMCDEGYRKINVTNADELIECGTAGGAFGAAWEDENTFLDGCGGGPKGCTIRRGVDSPSSRFSALKKENPDVEFAPNCNIICKEKDKPIIDGKMLESHSEPEGPSVSATCPDGYEREFGDSEPEWGDMVLASYWGARHAENIDGCASQCSNLTDCMSFKWSPTYLQGAVPRHPCVLTVNKHITTNNTFHDFIFCAKKEEESAKMEESADESAKTDESAGESAKTDESTPAQAFVQAPYERTREHFQGFGKLP